MPQREKKPSAVSRQPLAPDPEKKGTEKKSRRPRMSQPLSPKRMEELEQHAIELVEDGHREGGEMFELLDEVDRLSGSPPRSKLIANERGWNRRGGA